MNLLGYFVSAESSITAYTEGYSPLLSGSLSAMKYVDSQFLGAQKRALGMNFLALLCTRKRANALSKTGDFTARQVLVDNALARGAHGGRFSLTQRFFRLLRIAGSNRFLNTAPRRTHASPARLVDRRAAADDAVGLLCGLRIRHEGGIPDYVFRMRSGGV